MVTLPRQRKSYLRLQFAKGMDETKKLWELHADKSNIMGYADERCGHVQPIGYWETQGYPINDILENSAP